jgi:hypothetical protein
VDRGSRPVRHREEPYQAASATCRCGQDITYQQTGWWAHDSVRLPNMGSVFCLFDGERARPVDPGRLVRCPTSEAFRDDGIPILGCGSTFIQVLDDDPDGWADCPHCGLGFDPDHPANQPQPPEV